MAVKKKKSLTKKKPKKQFTLDWAFEAFSDHSTFYSKRMFGGIAAYVHDKIVMLISEETDTKEYRGKSYDFDLWNGILIPTEREFHGDIQKQFKNLVQHPVLGKWLYLQMADADFESTASEIAELISKNDHRFGVFPKEKKKRKKVKKKLIKP